MRPVLFLALLTLAACSRPSQPEASAPVEAPAPPPDSWPGKYWGNELRVTISGTPGAHRVTLITANEKCDGEIGVADGGVLAQGVSAGRLLVTAKDSYHEQTCRITIDKVGKSLSLTEDEGCTTYHGVFCSFAGTAERVK